MLGLDSPESSTTEAIALAMSRVHHTRMPRLGTCIVNPADASDRGMTILEVLIATMLLVVIALIIFSAFGIGLRAAALAGGMNTATSLAEETLATLTAAPCGSSFSAPIPQEVGGDRPVRYRREVSVHRARGNNLWEISATVTWTQERQQRSITLSTLRHISAACEFVGQ